MTQTTDAALVELLRGIAYVAGPDSQQNGMALDSEEAGLLTAYIEAQARRIEALEGALRPFAKAGAIAGERDPRWDFYAYRPAAGDEYAIMGDHLRTANATLGDAP